MRIVFTGGSGKAGRHCIPHLIERGHQVLNLDLVPHPDPRVYTLKTDLTQSGQVFNALSTHFSMEEYSLPSLPKVDAVIHFAAYARDLIVPDNETFTANVTSTYNVIEAACKLGIKKVVIASSETVYGVCFTQGESDYNCFPLEEGKQKVQEDRVTDRVRYIRLQPGRPICPVETLWRTYRTELRQAIQDRHLRLPNRKCGRTARVRKRLSKVPGQS